MLKTAENEKALEGIDSWEKLIAALKYKPDVTIEYIYDIMYDERKLRFQMLVQDVYHPEKRVPITMFQRVEPFDRLPLEYAISFVHDCLRQMELHECDEWFEINGVKIFDPHVMR